MWADVVARSLRAAGVRPGMKVHNAYGYGLFTGGQGAHAGIERLGATVIPVSGGQTARQVQLIRDFEPDAIMCTPSYLLTIADAFEDVGLDPRETSIKVAICGAEPWTNEMRLELERRTPRRAATDYRALEQDTSIRAFREDVLAGLGTDLYVDVRSVDEYTGRLSTPAHLPQEGGSRRGHIPGALSVPWNRSVARDGTFRPDAELRTLHAAALADTERRVVAYCRIGERSSHTWFVLHELLDHPNVVNYDGSWVEYGSLIGVPVER